MDFFEKLTETFAKNSKEFADKAKDYAEVAKLHTKINTANTKINESLITLGKAYYDAHKNDGNTEFEEIFEEIRKAHLTIQKCQEEIQKIKNIKICEKCGEEVSADATYCSHCGAKLKKTTDKKEEEADAAAASDLEEKAEEKKVICPSCGQELEANAEFCTKCGSSMK